MQCSVILEFALQADLIVFPNAGFLLQITK